MRSRVAWGGVPSNGVHVTKHVCDNSNMYAACRGSALCSLQRVRSVCHRYSSWSQVSLHMLFIKQPDPDDYNFIYSSPSESAIMGCHNPPWHVILSRVLVLTPSTMFQYHWSSRFGFKYTYLHPGKPLGLLAEKADTLGSQEREFTHCLSNWPRNTLRS